MTPNKKTASRPRFIALARGHELIRELRVIFQKIRQHDADEAKQIKRAANGVVRSIGEGRRRRGGDRLHLWRCAAGSAEEIQNSLWALEGWGHLEEEEIAPAIAKADEVLAILRTLTGD